MQPARRRQHHHIGIAAGQQRVQRTEARQRGQGGLLRDQPLYRLGLPVGQRDQLGALGVRCQRGDMVARDAPAADQGEAQLAVGDGGALDVHGWRQIMADA